MERVRFALASARAAADLEHNGVKGALREALIADLFRPLLPADFGVATGVIISSDDKQSAQQDIVVFDRRVLPPLLFEGPALIPIEAVLATIEVKSCLNATELRRAQENALSVQSLQMLSGIRNKDGQYVDPRLFDKDGNALPETDLRPPSMASCLLFALGSDLSLAGKSEIERFAEICGDNPHLIRGICIVGKGYFGPTQRVLFDSLTGKYHTLDSKPLKSELEKLIPADENHIEVITTISAIHNLVLRIAPTRGQPPLSGYLLP